MTVLQIVPSLPSKVCGVGDYAWLLAQALQKDWGIASRFLVADPAWDGTVPGAIATTVPGRSASDWLRALTPALVGVDAVVLQYSGYGYSAKGAPLGLAQALASATQRPRKVPVLTMFHELFASGPWWSKAFWFQQIQKHVCRRFVKLSRQRRTNRAAYALWLQRQGGRDASSVCTMPVFSNLGELSAPSVPSSREARLVLFQPPSAKTKQGDAFWRSFEEVRKALAPDEVIVAGRVLSLPPGSEFTVKGKLSQEDASALLASARYGFFDYYDSYLAKSGLFAAFASHGVACILASPNDSSADGLVAGQHYLKAQDAERLNGETMDTLAASLHQWYRGHDLATTARSLAEQLRTCC
ncbi:MAG: hypothetical protein ACOYMN_18820 [Roseimicrobium sp.]